MLDQWLASEVFAFFLVFCRMGSAIMLLPGIGEPYVSPRIRLLLALSISVLLAPVLKPYLPHPPTVVGDLVVEVVGEIIVGIFMGVSARLLISAVNTAGAVIATQSGLASALIFDIGETGQTTAVTNLLSVTAVTLLFAFDLHHVLLAALNASYDVFPAGHLPMLGDMVNFMASTFSRAFGVGLQIAAPQIAIGIILYLGAGVLSRLMPGVQIFFVLMSPQILLSFLVLMVTISGSMLWYMHYIDDSFTNFPNVP